jgi:hypothetical protein
VLAVAIFVSVYDTAFEYAVAALPVIAVLAVPIFVSVYDTAFVYADPAAVKAVLAFVLAAIAAS